MLGRLYEGQGSAAARTRELVGERWSLLILRDALFRGFTRFSDFQQSLGGAPNILSRRLEAFVGRSHADDQGSTPSGAPPIPADGQRAARQIRYRRVGRMGGQVARARPRRIRS